MILRKILLYKLYIQSLAQLCIDYGKFFAITTPNVMKQLDRPNDVNNKNKNGL